MKCAQESVWDYKELEFEHAVRGIAREAGWVSSKLMASNGKGMPDVMFLKQGCVVFAEFKTGSYAMTVEQQNVMRDLRNHGHTVLEIRPENLHEFVAILLREPCDIDTQIVQSMLRDVLAGKTGAVRKRQLRSATAGGPPLGYRVANRGSVTATYVVCESEALIVRECFRLAVAGYSQRCIAKMLTESDLGYQSTKIKGVLHTSFTAPFVCKILANEAYIGRKVLRWDGDYVVMPNVFPRLCTDEDWQIVRAHMASRSKASLTVTARTKSMQSV